MGRASRAKKQRRDQEERAGRLQHVRQPRGQRRLSAQVQAYGLGGQQQFQSSVPRDDNDPNAPINRAVPQGSSGEYRVVISLQRLGYAVYPERSFDYGGENGNSHLAIAPPAYTHAAVPGANTLHLEADTSDGHFVYEVFPNEKGFAAQVVTRLAAASFKDAGQIAYRNLAPTLSHWATYFDVPVVLARIEMEELQYGTLNMSIVNPYDEVPLVLEPGDALQQPLRVLESYYREAMNSNSPAYQFLCFCKILEGVLASRVRATRAAARAGQQLVRVDPESERVPVIETDFVPWLERLFPVRTRPWDPMALASIFITEAVGRTVEELFREGQRGKAPGAIRAVRNEVAHAVTGEGPPRQTADDSFHLERVNEWLPITKCLARLLLVHEFPRQLWQPRGE